MLALRPLLLLALAALSAPTALADDADDAWCKPDTVQSQVRRWGTVPFAKKGDFNKTVETLRAQLAKELLGTLAIQVDPRYQPEIYALTSRVQTLSTAQRKVKGVGREACVVVQMDKGGIVGDLPSEVGRQLLTEWHDSLVAFTAGRPVWVREVSLRDHTEPEIDSVVVPRVEDLVRRNLTGVTRFEPDGGPIPGDVITFDVRITPYPAYYAVEGVARDASGRSMSVGAELAMAWLGEAGPRLPLSSRDVAIKTFDSPATVPPGKPAKLSWETPNARRCSMEPGVGDVPPNSRIEVVPKGDTVYKLTCTDGVRTVSRETAVVVRIPPPFVSATMEPAAVPPGGSAVFSWMANNVTGCSVNHNVGAVGKAGSVPFTPKQTTTATVTCVGDDGTTVTGSAVITVDPLLVMQQVVDAVTPSVPATVTTPAAVSPSLLDIHVTDGNWLQVRVNGKTVAEFKNTTDATVTLEAAPAYFVEVVPFMSDEAVQSVTMSALFNGHGNIGVSLDQPINCYNSATCVP